MIELPNQAENISGEKILDENIHLGNEGEDLDLVLMIHDGAVDFETAD